MPIKKICTLRKNYICPLQPQQGQQPLSAQQPNRPAPLPAQAQPGQAQTVQAQQVPAVPAVPVGQHSLGQSNTSGRQISSQTKVK